MKETVYRGSIHSVLPQKGYGFIKPDWGETSEDNIYFYLPDTKKGRKCFIPALSDPEARVETTSHSGVRIVAPAEPQIVYFKLEEQIREGKPSKLIARDLTDDNHVSDEMRATAEANSKVKPQLQDSEEQAAMEVAETSNDAYEEEPDGIVEEHVEEEYVEDDYDDDYDDKDEVEEDDEYDEYEEYQDMYDRLDAKASRRYTPKDNREN